ncbi:hypothetical protein GJAV_G00017920 [Gymnothorax javanicus]|nr:hypothetical protein GJAV_G00017920 [Gymnothorax javanicus]
MGVTPNGTVLEGSLYQKVLLLFIWRRTSMMKSDDKIFLLCLMSMNGSDREQHCAALSLGIYDTMESSANRKHLKDEGDRSPLGELCHQQKNANQLAISGLPHWRTKWHNVKPVMRTTEGGNTLYLTVFGYYAESVPLQEA